MLSKSKVPLCYGVKGTNTTEQIQGFLYLLVENHSLQTNYILYILSINSNQISM